VQFQYNPEWFADEDDGDGSEDWDLEQYRQQQAEEDEEEQDRDVAEQTERVAGLALGDGGSGGNE
jgi:hypothetical protein